MSTLKIYLFEIHLMINDIQAILFCGGRGSRLYPITDFYQKVMMPIGKNGKPILEYVINHLKQHNITEFVALVGYRHNLIRRYFGNGEKWGVNIQYVVDDPNMKGTGGALYNARNTINQENLLIYYTDILTNMDIKELYDFFSNNDSLATIWVDPNWLIVDGVVSHDNENNVISIDHHPSEKVYANTGISIIKRSVINIIEKLVLDYNKKQIDLSSDIFPRIVEQGKMNALSKEFWWTDIGSLKRYRDLKEDLITEKFGRT